MNHLQELRKIDFIFLKGEIRKSFSDNTVIGIYASANIKLKNDLVMHRLIDYIQLNKLPFSVEPYNDSFFKIMFIQNIL